MLRGWTEGEGRGTNQLQVHAVNDLTNYSEERNKKASIPSGFKEGTPGVAGGGGDTLPTHSLTQDTNACFH